jgi:hypothetical protein
LADRILATSSAGIGLPGLVGGEAAEHAGVPGPLLEELGGRLDEVPLGGDAREPHPVVASGDDVVDQMAELVEQGDDVAMLHELAGEVADEDSFCQLTARDPAHEVELGGVLVLALSRVQVEMDTSYGTPLGRDVVDRDVAMPPSGLGHRGVHQPEQAAGDVQHSVGHLLEVEVPADLLGIHAVRSRRTTSP